jgi:undecaprenyl diphosphate synthase
VRQLRRSRRDRARRALAADAVAGRVDVDAIDEHALARYLQQPDLPDVDLVVRYGGDQRLSNFLLWQVAYAEIVTPQRLWPDFDGDGLRQALREFGARERRFGGHGGAPLPVRPVASACPCSPA